MTTTRTPSTREHAKRPRALEKVPTCNVLLFVVCFFAASCSNTDNRGAVDAGLLAPGVAGPGTSEGAESLARDRLGSCLGPTLVCPGDSFSQYEECVLSECEDVFLEAYGGPQVPGIYAGLCADFQRCQETCRCGGINCMTVCYDNRSEACAQALDAHSGCADACELSDECVAKPASNPATSPVAAPDIGCVPPPALGRASVPDGTFVGGCYLRSESPGGVDRCYMWSSTAVDATEAFAKNCEAMGDIYCEWGCPAKNAAAACYNQRTLVHEWDVYYSANPEQLAPKRDSCLAVWGVWTDDYNGNRFTQP